MRRKRNVAAHVYRCYDNTGRLIYVGCAGDMWVRMQNHRSASWWITQLDRLEVTDYRTLKAARATERRAIRDEQPRWNVDIRHDFRENWGPSDYEDYIRARRQRSVERRDCVAIGIPLPSLLPSVYEAMAALQAEYRDRFGGHLDIGPRSRSRLAVAS